MLQADIGGVLGERILDAGGRFLQVLMLLREAAGEETSGQAGLHIRLRQRLARTAGFAHFGQLGAQVIGMGGRGKQGRRRQAAQ